ncbi:MAG: carbamoyltransferase HypF [Acidobacteriota bacterium]
MQGEMAQPVSGVESRSRLRLTIRGAVQGVGFRPFIYRLALELRLTGWVNNSAQGVFIEVEGERQQLENFLLRIEPEKPPQSFIQSLESAFLDAKGFTKFEIIKSDDAGAKTAIVLPDIATCKDCLSEIFDPTNRRYRYPFTNCTNCGPRFSIIEALPYDRVSTTMKKFAMCEACKTEYENPLDRRFHAQPNACPACGPQLELWNREGKSIAAKDRALLAAADAIRQGAVVAVKGLGGFHLMVDARNDEAVKNLRQRKRREEKPFALMCPSLASIKALCQVSDLEARMLVSSESPIILLKRKPKDSGLQTPDSRLSDVLAPDNPYLGVMLAYTPLHHLLMNELGFPVVATSGNLSDEPICIDEFEALERLKNIADVFLVHNRPIARHVDDSIVRVMAGRELVMRRARGFAPLPVHLKETSKVILATGAHLKNTVALAVGKEIFLSQHIGDLETAEAYGAFQQVIASFKNLYEAEPAQIACDAHPDYLSTKFAKASDVPITSIQHHFAHVMACLAENEIAESALGVAWDGTGYGTDGTIWGGEFLQVSDGAYRRVAHFRAFHLPGGDRAIKEPRRIALGLLYEIFGDAVFAMDELAPVGAFTAEELSLLKQMLQKQINAPLTSSAGRLFDAVAAIINLYQRVRFEGQAAMQLEFALDGTTSNNAYQLRIAGEAQACCELRNNKCHSSLITHHSSLEANDSRLQTPDSRLIFDWQPMILGIIEDWRKQIPVAEISVKFHNTLVEAIVSIARLIGEQCVVLTGGCFQNKYLTERAVARLREEGFRPYWHQRIPPNDGGIALGQAFATIHTMKEE